MIPYFQFTVFHLGPLPIQVWGLMVALGILAATWVAAKLARRRGQNPEVIWDLCFWAILGAFLFARLFQFFYHPQLYLQDPFELFRVWHGGFSMVGGLFGAALFGLTFLHKKKVDVFAYADTALFGLPLGIGIGRIGCFLIHDHPGTLTHFILGVNYPGGARHDHGLYLSINGFILFFLFLWLARKNARTGTYVVAYLLWDGVTRFALDFFRATDLSSSDVRYFSLTPAQYFSVLMVILGVWIFIRKKLPNRN
ncbi:MAG: prolipoprotein diacylglyceryl transferase [Patescibacteria group bacterium]